MGGGESTLGDSKRQTQNQSREARHLGFLSWEGLFGEVKMNDFPVGVALCQNSGTCHMHLAVGHWLWTTEKNTAAPFRQSLTDSRTKFFFLARPTNLNGFLTVLPKQNVNLGIVCGMMQMDDTRSRLSLST